MQQPAHALHSAPSVVGAVMLVNLEGYGPGGVTEEVLERLRVSAAPAERCGVCVTEGMEPATWNACLLAEGIPPAGEVVRMDVASGRARDDGGGPLLHEAEPAEALVLELMPALEAGTERPCRVDG